jgi:diadenosine tetraphosphate (Ap4A) HIT family hydrolase
MVDVNSPCVGCAIARGEVRPTGGVLLRQDGLVLHGIASPSPLPGWLVVTSERHVRGLWDLPEEAARGLGPLASRAARALREVLHAEHVYAFVLGDVLHHFHLHLVPRFADTPPELRGRGAFDARPSEALEPEVLEAAAAALAEALGEALGEGE